MSAEKTLAIVIRTVDFSETSSVVTLFTEDFGKITALAKGCKRPKSPFESALDVLTVSRIVFLHKKSDSLDLLTEAKVERRFRAGQKSVDHLYAGYYVAELLAEMTDRSDPYQKLFRLSERVLSQLNDLQEVAPLVLRFEMMLLRYLGQLPELTQCVETGEPIADSGRTPFGLLAGGVLSKRARSGHRHVIDVAVDSLKLLSIYAAEDERWKTTEIPPRLAMEVRALVNRYMSHTLGKTPRLREYLRILAI
ncbi:DNA repair protein RecO [Bremerella cremea]|uniref:DNA repair protein RecO n=1 Tax=Bremerella cremea TaxID=1031537 RepID=A0A368KSN5_9BACT|nr:DNA repair protein RecO [Bremerella cremea]RCS51898.1 DNA repair protein RecO [Bremerella cremea]